RPTRAASCRSAFFSGERTSPAARPRRSPPAGRRGTGRSSTLAPLQHREESLLRDLDCADLFHAFLALFLLFEQLALARHVAAVALGEHVLAQRLDVFARDDMSADGGLDSDVEHLSWDQPS